MAKSNEEILKEFDKFKPCSCKNVKDSCSLCPSLEEYKDFIRTILIQKDAEIVKARENWLREEIVRLEGMTLGGHRDEDKRIYAGGYDEALQTIIDRYQKELKVISNKQNV